MGGVVRVPRRAGPAEPSHSSRAPPVRAQDGRGDRRRHARGHGNAQRNLSPDGTPLTFSIVANGCEGHARPSPTPSTGASTYAPSPNANGPMRSPCKASTHGTCSGRSDTARRWSDVSGRSVYTLTVAPAPTNGKITGPGIDCGLGAIDCSEPYDDGTTVTLTAAPESGYGLGAWTGGCPGGVCHMTQDRTVGANLRSGDGLSVRVNDVSVVERDCGTHDLTFTISLDTTSPMNVAVSYTTEDVSALAGCGLHRPHGQVVIPAGQLSQTVSIQVIGDGDLRAQRDVQPPPHGLQLRRHRGRHRHRDDHERRPRPVNRRRSRRMDAQRPAWPSAARACDKTAPPAGATQEPPPPAPLRPARTAAPPSSSSRTPATPCSASAMATPIRRTPTSTTPSTPTRPPDS